jgi:hypothetical protein
MSSLFQYSGKMCSSLCVCVCVCVCVRREVVIKSLLYCSTLQLYNALLPQDFRPRLVNEREEHIYFCLQQVGLHLETESAGGLSVRIQIKNKLLGRDM